MIRTRIQFSGVEEVLKNIEQLPGNLGRFVVADGLKAGADVLRDAARRSSEFEDDSGVLRRTIRSRKSRSKISAQVLAGGRRGFYAFWVEYGTVHKAPQPYLEAALIASDDLMFNAMVVGMQQSFADLGSRLLSGVGVTREIRRLARA